MQLWMSDCSFTQRNLNIHREVVTALLSCYTAGATWNCCHLGASSVYAIQVLCMLVLSIFIWRHIRRVHVCLAVTCHLLFWQHHWDLLCATAVTRGWNGYRNRSQHKKLTLEKKLLPPLLLGSEPVTFPSQGWCSTTELSPLPFIYYMQWN